MVFVFLRFTFILLSFAITNLSIASEKIFNSQKSIVAPLASKTLLLDIAIIADNKLVAVGHHGHILTSSDGSNWNQASVPVQSTLTSVFFINNQLGWAVGHDATILNTTDGGVTWKIQLYKPEIEKPLFDVIFKSPNEGVAIGAYGLTFRTQDGGKSWHNEFHDELLFPEDATYLSELKLEDEIAYLDEASFILPHFNRLVLDGRTLYVVGEIGLIAKSNDFGKQWVPLESIYQGSFFDIARTTQGSLLVVGLRGHVFRSQTNGTSWQLIKTNTTALINDIVISEDGRIFLLANNGTLLESLDDGQSFSLKIQLDGKALIAGTWFNNKLMAVSDVGIKTIKP